MSADDLNVEAFSTLFNLSIRMYPKKTLEYVKEQAQNWLDRGKIPAESHAVIQKGIWEWAFGKEGDSKYRLISEVLGDQDWVMGEGFRRMKQSSPEIFVKPMPTR